VLIDFRLSRQLDFFGITGGRNVRLFYAQRVLKNLAQKPAKDYTELVNNIAKNRPTKIT
jgi:hypothetical protein